MNMTEKRAKRNSAGYTLIEIAISTSIILLISVVALKFWINTSEAFTLDGNRAVLKQQSERALEIMTERISQGTNGTFVLSNGNSTLDFVDGSDLSNIQYTLNPLAPTAPAWGEIVQTIDGVQGPIGGYAQALQFTASPTGLITINPTFSTGKGRTQTTLTVQSSVAARN